MTPLEATRAWLRTCPHIDKNDKLNLNHLGAAPTGYSLTLTGHTRKEDVCGSVTSVYHFALFARMPWGPELAMNIAASEFFAGLDEWIWAQERAHAYPAIDGETPVRAEAKNAGLIVAANAQAAQYQIQIELTTEEVSPYGES